MNFQKIWVLRGPNVWARVPVLEVDLDLGGVTLQASQQIPGFAARLLAWLPSLEKRLGVELHHGMHLANVLQATALEVQFLCGSPVKFGLVRPLSEGISRVIIEFEEEEVGRACLEEARALCLAAVQDLPFEVNVALRRLRELAYDIRLGPSTSAIVRAARLRNIPMYRLNRDSLVQLGQGARQRRICTAATDQTSGIAELIAQDKELTRSLLQAVGVPVPEGRPVADAADAWAATLELGPPVVVKPQDGNHGRGVATNLTTRNQVQQAYAAARQEGPHIVVERFAPGADHRLLVIGDKLVAAALREPAQVLGDGRSSIDQLVARVNQDPRRSDGHATVLSHIKLDTVSLAVLTEQGYTPESVPAAGARVLIRRNANLSTGGTAGDVTDRVHPEVAARAIDAARVVGLDIAGVDVVATDISRPLESQGGVVVEVNAGPGLRMHLAPSAGKARPVGEAIVAMLFPEGHNGRIPLAAVTGVHARTATTRLLAHLLRATGQVVGMTGTAGVFLDNRRIDSGDGSAPRCARALLLNPRVEAAVVEIDLGGILREGLGFDQCSVAVVTDSGAGSSNGQQAAEDLPGATRTLVEAVASSGAAVLNAEDPLVAALARYCPGEVIFFSRDAAHPLITSRLQGGGRAVFARRGAVVLAWGEREEAALPLASLSHPSVLLESVLPAVAAAWALGASFDVIRAGLNSFRGSAPPTPAPGQAPEAAALPKTMV